MSRSFSLVVLVLLLVAAAVGANRCHNGATEEEVTTPGLVDGLIPQTGQLMQQSAKTLTLWPVSFNLGTAQRGNITGFSVGLGSCSGTGCTTGNVQIGLYHYHAVGKVDPNEAGHLHLIAYSSLIPYHPNRAAGVSTGGSTATKSSQLAIPKASIVNTFTGYYLGINSDVPYGVFTSGLSIDVPLTMAYDPSSYHAGTEEGMLPKNPIKADFTQTFATTEAALGFFFCPQNADAGNGGGGLL